MDDEIILSLIALISVLLCLGVMLVPIVISIVALVETRRIRREWQAALRRMDDLERRPGTTPAPAAVQPAVAAPREVAAPARVPAPPPASANWIGNLEQKAGKRWMIWGGVGVLFLAAGFFVKYAIDNEWIGPTARIVLGAMAGTAMLVAGDLSVRRRMRALGQGLMGGGMGILYVSLFAGLSLYDLYPREAAFGLMVFVTAAGTTLAVLHDAPAVSILALLGGLATPLMVSTGEDARDALFSYLLLLDLGVLAVMILKQWRALDLIAFLGTMALYAGWWFEFYDGDGGLLPALAWLAAFFAVFLLSPFLHHLVTRWPIHIDRFILALANASVTFGFVVAMLDEDHRHALGFVAVGMSAVYAGLGAITRRRLTTDARSVFGFVAIAIILLTIAVPLHLELSGITLGWAVEGPALLAMGYAFGYLPARLGAVAVLALAAGRLLFLEMPLHEDHYVMFLNLKFWNAMTVVASAAAVAALHRAWRSRSVLADRWMQHGAAILAAFLAALLVQEELRIWLDTEAQTFAAWCVPPVAWAACSAGLMSAGSALRSMPPRVASLPVWVLAISSGFLAYVAEPSGTHILFFNWRFAAGLAAVAVGFGWTVSIERWASGAGSGERIIGKVVMWLSILSLFLLLSMETFSWCWIVIEDPVRARWASVMSLSIVWAVYASALLGIGFARDVRAMRFTALGLFFLTALKVVLLDMASVAQIFRIVSFFALGILMTGASFLYHRAEKAWQAKQRKLESENTQREDDR